MNIRPHSSIGSSLTKSKDLALCTSIAAFITYGTFKRPSWNFVSLGRYKTTIGYIIKYHPYLPEKLFSLILIYWLTTLRDLFGP